jgi:8-oxo-dGTP diphosphatase
MSAALKSMIVGLVSDIVPTDDLGHKHRQNALTWLAGTDDIFRRVKPLTPSPHLVSYFLLVDRPAGSVLLCDHRLSGLWLPSGGHVEPGEHPLTPSGGRPSKSSASPRNRTRRPRTGRFSSR